MDAAVGLLQVDGRVQPEKIDEWAAQAGAIPPQVRRILTEQMLQAETPDFYQGLLAGLVAGATIRQSGLHPIMHEALIAMTCSHIKTGTI